MKISTKCSLRGVCMILLEEIYHYGGRLWGLTCAPNTPNEISHFLLPFDQMYPAPCLPVFPCAPPWWKWTETLKILATPMKMFFLCKCGHGGSVFFTGIETLTSTLTIYYQLISHFCQNHCLKKDYIYISKGPLSIKSSSSEYREIF